MSRSRRVSKKAQAAWKAFVEAAEADDILKAAVAVMKWAGDLSRDVEAPTATEVARAVSKDDISNKRIISANKRLNETSFKSRSGHFSATVEPPQDGSTGIGDARPHYAIKVIWRPRNRDADDVCEDLAGLHERWRRCTNRPPHPIFPLLQGYFERAREVQVNLRRSRGYLPSIRGGNLAPEREAGLRLAGLLDDRQAVQLPVLPTTAHSPTPLLDIVDVMNGPVPFCPQTARSAAGTSADSRSNAFREKRRSVRHHSFRGHGG